MRFSFIVLAAVVALLVALDASPVLASNGRSLRIATTRENNEERVGLLTKIRSTFSKKAKVDAWVEAEKSDDFVRKALKMENVADNNLWATKNFKYYQRFVEKSEAKKINDWLIGDVPTYSAWVKLGLDSFDDIEKVKSTGAFQTYAKFVREYDDQAISMWREYNIPVPVAKATSPIEMNVRMDILATTKRGDSYAKQVLGLDELTGTALTSHPSYQYFQHYQRTAKRLKNRDKLNRLPTITER